MQLLVDVAAFLFLLLVIVTLCYMLWDMLVQPALELLAELMDRG